MSEDELAAAMRLIEATVQKCESAKAKFKNGTSQHSLLENRISALRISMLCITSNPDISKCTNGEIVSAVAPLRSIVSKSEKARLRFAEGKGHHTSLTNLINAMKVALDHVGTELSKRKIKGTL